MLKLVSRTSDTDDAMLYGSKTLNASATINIENGGALLISRNAYYSSASAVFGVHGGTASITIDGQHSRMSLKQNVPDHSMDGGSADLVLGYGGTADLTLSNGGAVLLHGDGAHLQVGATGGSSATLEVLSGSSVSVRADGTANQRADIWVGGRVGEGDMIIDGAGSSVAVVRSGGRYGYDAVARILVGADGNGHIAVTHGSKLAISGDYGAQLGIGFGAGGGRLDIGTRFHRFPQLRQRHRRDRRRPETDSFSSATEAGF